MGAYGYLLALALILLFTKIFRACNGARAFAAGCGRANCGNTFGAFGYRYTARNRFSCKNRGNRRYYAYVYSGIDTDINELKHTDLPPAL